MSINLIGISGKKGVGKDLVADIIKYLVAVKEEFPDQETYSYEDFRNYMVSCYYSSSKWKNVKFADKLKDIVCLLLNCTREQLEDREFKEKELGEEWKLYMATGYSFENEREYNIYASESEIPKSYRLFRTYISTPREILQLLGTECGRNIIHPNIWVNSTMNSFNKDSKWIISDVRFPNEAEAIKEKGGILIRIDRPGFTDTSNHESEIALDRYTGFDFTIINDSTIDSLILTVKTILKTNEII